jgi:hypothetical protein
MQGTVIYDITQDSFALARCAFLPIVGGVLWLALTLSNSFTSDPKLRRNNLVARVLVVAVPSFVGIATLLAQLNARRHLREHETFQACGILHGFTKAGRDGTAEHFYVGSTPFLTHRSDLSPGFNGSLAHSKWVDSDVPLRAEYFYDDQQLTILRLSEAPDCVLPPASGR